ncbi:MAG: S8 family serine peptidase [Desulfobacteraceae bacterium]|jgi:subtilisin family serine protease
MIRFKHTFSITLAAVIIMTAGTVRSDNTPSSGLLRGRSAPESPVILPSGGNYSVPIRSSDKKEKDLTSEGLVLRVRQPAGKGLKGIFPEDSSCCKQRFKAISAITGNSYYIVTPEKESRVSAAVKASDDSIEVFPNIVKHLNRTIPDDPFLSDQWCHLNQDNPYSDMDSAKVWDISTGSTDAVIALIDSGVDYNHPDLSANIWVNPGEIAGNGIDDDGNGYVDDIHGIDSGDGDTDPMDYDGHGTHVAGIMGAVGDNGLGVAGVNWQVKIMVLKGFEEESDGMDTQMELEAIDYLIDMKSRGINIVAVNASYGYTGEEDVLEKEAIEALGQADILFMAAAGNDEYNNDSSTSYSHYPSSYDLDNIISMAASDDDGMLAWFSNYRASSVDLAAPGDTILSTVMSEHTYTPDSGDFFFDDMESGIGNWTPEGTWAITEEQAVSPNNAWSDSPDGRYDTYQDMALTSPVIDLSHETTRMALGFSINYEIEDWAYYSYFDALQVWFLAPPENDGEDPVWEEIGSIAGSSDGQWEIYSALIPERFFWDGFQFRFVLHSDYSIQKDGVYIDDIGIGVPGFIYPYEYYSGTSMATPQVTGAAGLVASHCPESTSGEIKVRILEGTMPLSDLEGMVATGGMLNLAGILSDDPALDRDGDTVPDFYDNCAATENSGQADSDSDGYGNACDCDLNNDDSVNQIDFMQFRSYWGANEEIADFNGDGTVNQMDFMIFRSRWGTSAPFE